MTTTTTLPKVSKVSATVCDDGVRIKDDAGYYAKVLVRYDEKLSVWNAGPEKALVIDGAERGAPDHSGAFRAENRRGAKLLTSRKAEAPGSLPATSQAKAAALKLIRAEVKALASEVIEAERARVAAKLAKTSARFAPGSVAAMQFGSGSDSWIPVRVHGEVYTLAFDTEATRYKRVDPAEGAPYEKLFVEVVTWPGAKPVSVHVSDLWDAEKRGVTAPPECAECHRPMSEDECGGEWAEDRVCDSCAGVTEDTDEATTEPQPKLLDRVCTKGKQSLDYRATWRLGGHTLRVRRKRDFYDFQSHAVIERHDGSAWQKVETIPGEGLSFSAGDSSVSNGTRPNPAEIADEALLLRKAALILGVVTS